MRQSAIEYTDVSHAVGMAILVLLAAMGCGWLFRLLILRMLRSRHPQEFADLGQPSSRQLVSLSPRLQELHIKFWKYLWGGKVFLNDDKRVTNLAWLALVSDAAVAGSVAVLFWLAWK
jgi:hypothetical protein